MHSLPICHQRGSGNKDLIEPHCTFRLFPMSVPTPVTRTGWTVWRLVVCQKFLNCRVSRALHREETQQSEYLQHCRVLCLWAVYIILAGLNILKCTSQLLLLVSVQHHLFSLYTFDNKIVLIKLKLHININSRIMQNSIKAGVQ